MTEEYYRSHAALLDISENTKRRKELGVGAVKIWKYDFKDHLQCSHSIQGASKCLYKIYITYKCRHTFTDKPERQHSLVSFEVNEHGFDFSAYYCPYGSGQILNVF